MEEIGVSVASKVAEGLVDRVVRACSYVIFHARYLRELEDEVASLDRTRQKVQHSVDEAQTNMKPIEAVVEQWKTDANSVADKVSDMRERYEKSKKTYFCGWLPNPMTRYHIVREATETVKAIQELIPKGEFNKVYYENPPPGHVPDASDVSSPEGDGGKTMSKSQASILEDIMNALEDEKFKVIGVYGPGGVGKSTLLEKVEKKLRKEGRPFHMIVKAKVSQTPDLAKIQYDIAYALDLKTLKDEPSEEGRRDLLFKRLQMDPSKKVLIILDDLWAELDLKAVGIPMGDESVKCKLLLTSRDKSVLEQRMHAKPTFHLEGLKEDEAFRLFEKTVGNKLQDNEELKAKAAQVVRKLAGLPLLITSVASTLNFSEMSTWDNALIKIEDPNIEKVVKWSYDHLESVEIKSLFLLCGLIGGSIQVELLLGLGMGLGLFEGFNKTIQSSRNKLNDMLRSLRSACLLQDGGDDKENVTIHDLYSEAVVSNAFSGQNSLMINYGSWPKEKLEKCWACLVTFGSDRLVELMPCRFPHVKILTLSEQHDMGDCSRMDFTYMKELRVLCLRSMDITSLPSSMEILGNLQSLSINCNVEDVAILGKLKALRILNFAGSEISRLPKEIGNLTNLQSLNLSNCYWLEIIEPGAIKGLINLEELHMKGSFDEWMGEHEIPSESCGVGLAELKSLTKLASLEISIRHPIILLKDGDLPFGNLIRFWIDIGIVGDREFEGLTTMKLELEGCNNILSREWVQKALQKTQYLNLCKLSEFKESAHELCTQRFRELKHLHIDDSPSIKYIANSSDAFMKLESLCLENLINMEKIYHGPIAPECFSKLKAVTVRRCGRLKYLWRLSDMQRLVQLEEIDVWNCDSMQSIVIHDAREEIVSADYRVELLMPNVRRLELDELPNMTSFCTKAEITSEHTPIQVSFPRLESLVMVGLLDLEKILYGQPPLEYNNLKSIEIRESKCMLKSILKSDWILKIPNLESLEIKSCQSTEVVFDLEELYHGPIALECFSKLKAVSVSQCDGLKYLWRLSNMQRFVRLEEIEVRHCDSMQSIITHDAGEEIVSADNKIELPNVRRLVLGELPNMTSFCTRAEITSEHTPIQVSFPSLESLVMVGLLDLEKILYGQPPLEYNNLKSIKIRDSRSKSSFFKSDWIVKLPNLESLKIESSPSAEVVFDLGELKVMRDVKILSRLMELTIRESSNLQCMWKQDVKLQGISVFQSLTKLKVIETGLAFLFPVSVAKCLREIRDIEVKNCPNMKAVIVDEEGRDEWTDDVIEFPLLEELRICSCPMEKFFSYLYGNKEPVTVTSDSQDAYSDSFFDQKARFPNMTSLDIDGAQCKELWNNQIPIDSFCKLKSLKLKHCDNLLRIAPSRMWKRLQCYLETLIVDSCRSIEITFEGDGYAEKRGNMRKLILWDLDKLRHIWQYDGLPKGGEIRDIEVKNCPNMEAVIAYEEGRGEGTDDVIEFPLLERISIRRCPTDKFFSYPHGKKQSVTSTSDSQDAYSDSFFDPKACLPSLKTLYFYEVGSFQRIWRGDLPRNSFCELATLSLDCCSDLLNVFPSTIIGRLHNLQRVEIESCPSLESLFDCGSLDANTEQTTVLLPKLEKVTVCKAGKLRSLVKGDSQMILGFPSLQVVQVDNCSDMKYLFPHFTATTLEKLERINISHCEQMKEVVLVQEGGRSKEEVMRFPSVEYLSLSQCRNFGAFIRSPTSVKRQLDEMAEKNDESPQPLFNEMVTFPNIRELEIEGLQCKELWNNQIPIDSFCKLESLELKKCDNLRRIAPSHMWKRLQRCLEILEVISCRSIEIVYEGDGTDTKGGKLRRLVLRDLESLRHICRSDGPKRKIGEMAEKNDESPQPLFNEMVTFLNIRELEIEGLQCKELWNNQIPIDSFCKLESLELKKCDNLRRIAPSHMWKRLQRCLEILEVISCRSIEIVYEGDGTDTKGGKLRRLVLRDLESLRHICRSDGLKRKIGEMAEKNDESPQPLFNEMVTFPNIRELEIEGLQCKELWNNQIPTDSFCKLESLELKKCDNLRRIAPSHMWKRLQRCLEILQVISCRSIEIVYEGDGTDTESSKLRRLVLRDLENLRHIWRSDGLPNVPFPNLRDVEAVRCSRLEMLFATFTGKFLGHIEELVVESCEDMKLIADHEKGEGATCTTITFSKLTVLRLFELPKFRSFLPEKYSLKFPYSEDFPSLRDLSVVRCGSEGDRGIIVDDWEIHRRQRRERWLWEHQERWRLQMVSGNIE